jgi:hydroquinone glucosyltransferase
MFELVRCSLSHLRELIITRGGPVAVLVCDFFGTSALPLAAELGEYCDMTSSAIM